MHDDVGLLMFQQFHAFIFSRAGIYSVEMAEAIIQQ